MTTQIAKYKILKSFGVFSMCSEDDIDIIKSDYLNKKLLQNNMEELLKLKDNTAKSMTIIEIFSLLTLHCFKNNFNNIEICALYSIFNDILLLSFRKYTKTEIFDFFKESIINKSMDRPPWQIGVFNKQTLESACDFFIETIYKKFNTLKYLMTKNKNIEIYNKDMIDMKLPQILNIELAQEMLPRNAKILKQYTENKKPKSDLEMKIEEIVEFERDNIEKQLDIAFKEQDEMFTKKIDNLIKNKKK